GGFHTRAPTLGWGVLSGAVDWPLAPDQGPARVRGWPGMAEALSAGCVLTPRIFPASGTVLLHFLHVDRVQSQRRAGGSRAYRAHAEVLLDTVPRRGAPGSSPTPG